MSSEIFTYTISSDNEKCDFSGNLPVGNQVFQVILIDEKTREPRKGNFYVEHTSGNYNVFEMREGKRLPVYSLIGRSQHSSRTIDCFFAGDPNAKLIDSIIAELKENETYLEIEYPTQGEIKLVSKPSSPWKASRFSSAKIIRTRYIKSVKEKLYLLKGLPQSCKSGVMAQIGIKLWQAGKSSVIIFRAEGDRIQFITRLREMIQDIKKYTVGISRDISFLSAKDDLSPTEFLKALQGENPTIYLLIGNDRQLTKVNEAFSDAFTKSNEEAVSTYALIIDEADWVDSESRTASGSRKGERTLKSVALEKIKKYAYAILEVSATILDIASRDDIMPSNVKILTAPVTYRGIPSFNIVNTEKVKYSRSIGDDLLNTDGELSRIIDGFFQKTWNYVNTKGRCKHPNIMLISSGSCVEPQLKLFRQLKDRYPESTLMVHVGYGVHIYNPRLTKPFKPNEQEKLSKLDNEVHILADSCPSNVLLWLKRNMNEDESVKNIVIIAGDMAGRSTSYACKDSGAELPFWHLTDYRLVLASSSSAPNVIQKAARLATVFESPIPLNLYVSQQDQEAIIRSHYLQEEYIERSKEFPDEEYLKTVLANISMYKNKFPKGRQVTNTRVLKPKRVRTKKDGGWDISTYAFDEEAEENSSLAKREEGYDTEDASEHWRWVDRSIMRGHMAKTYDAAVGILKSKFRLGEVVPRADIVTEIMAVTSGMCISDVKGRLTDMYQKKCKKVDQSTSGLWIQKLDGIGGRINVKLV